MKMFIRQCRCWRNMQLTEMLRNQQEFDHNRKEQVSFLQLAPPTVSSMSWGMSNTKSMENMRFLSWSQRTKACKSDWKNWARRSSLSCLKKSYLPNLNAWSFTHLKYHLSVGDQQKIASRLPENHRNRSFSSILFKPDEARTCSRLGKSKHSWLAKVPKLSKMMNTWLRNGPSRTEIAKQAKIGLENAQIHPCVSPVLTHA